MAMNKHEQQMLKKLRAVAHDEHMQEFGAVLTVFTAEVLEQSLKIQTIEKACNALDAQKAFIIKYLELKNWK